MKKIIALLLPLCFVTTTIISAQQNYVEQKYAPQKNETKITTEEKTDHGITVSLKNGYFYPQDKILRSIFDKKGSSGGYWVEGAVRYDMWKSLNLEASASYFKRSGCALCGTEKTSVSLPTLGLGLKYIWRADEKIRPYAGAGMRLFFYREKNNSAYVASSVKRTQVGGMLNTGFDVTAYKDFSVGLFADYNFARLGTKRKCCTVNTSTDTCSTCCPSCSYSLNLGGLISGISLSYSF